MVNQNKEKHTTDPVASFVAFTVIGAIILGGHQWTTLNRITIWGIAVIVGITIGMTIESIRKRKQSSTTKPGLEHPEKREGDGS